ncbi:hypothetical protein O3P69_020085 [Scylla paramamosain]|uniref:Uncharacterized protein n=1 Tax=Scylla paramamosain TaxID=85552 RepID=A0AAW0TMR1_SCYPA
MKTDLVKHSVSWSFLPRTSPEADQCFATCTPTRPRKYIFLRIIQNKIFCGCGASEHISGPVSETECGSAPDPHLGSDKAFAVYKAGAARCPLSPFLYLAAAAALMTLVVH